MCSHCMLQILRNFNNYVVIEIGHLKRYEHNDRNVNVEMHIDT